MSRYSDLGVDVKKKGVESFRGIVENLFPNAFCIVQRDPDNPRIGLVAHTDGAGSKPIQSYLHWKETGDPTWFQGLAQDVIAMNLDDIICVAAKPVSFIDYITLNPYAVNRVSLLESLAQGFSQCFKMLKNHGISILFAGGETADHPDQLRTLDISGSVFGRVELDKVVTGEKIEPGDLIIGIESGGKASYEQYLNSGIMCNGLTLARNCLMDKSYASMYPEIAHSGDRCLGRFKFDHYVDELDMSVGEALLSPTRVFAPIVKSILSQLGESIHGMVHNTGGGITKCLQLGRGIHYIKDTLPEPYPIFRLIQRESRTDWKTI
ncbi:phosphoribosylformylglycinamidine cyclo-ligase, partial [Candidatus Bathyarchaeota archaeon]|nr:phosphoribosylformylglycinamidine cyclo-ligase [Candidatus Bathyarchaeota archaeon]